MSLIVYEKQKSPQPKYNNPTAQGGSSDDRTWIVLGTSDPVAAAEAALAVAPLVLGTVISGEALLRQTCVPEPTGAQSWEVAISYGPEDDEKSQQAPEAGNWRFSFDTTGGTHKLMQSIANIWKGERSGSYPAPDLRGAIGWDGKKLNGVDAIVPKLEFSIEAFYPAASVTTEFVANLARATGKTNDEPWLDFADGELLFLGAAGNGDIPLHTGTRVKPIPVTLKFAASENREDFTVGEISVPSKRGWEYLWVRYEQQENPTTHLVRPIPVHAYVEQIYEETDFADLFGFGGM